MPASGSLSSAALAAHWPLGWTLALAVVAAGLLGLSWQQVGRTGVPARRRRRRRAGTVLLGLLVVALVLGLGVIDAGAAPAAYAASWLMASLLVLACLGLALLDALEVVREQARAERDATRRTLEQLLQESRRAEDEDAG